MAYSIEVGEDKKPSTCKCCGQASYTGHGFVYKNDDAHAVYYVGWSEHHAEKKVSFALAIGEWDDESTNKDRTCFGVELTDGNKNINFRVLESSESPWAYTDLLGSMLSRDDALAHKLLSEVFEIIESVIHSHSALKNYLDI